MRKEEKGALILEATIVFPVMFFILLFLIYTGNMFYIRSQVDSIASRGAIQAAAYVADPMLEEVKESGSVPRSINNVQPYHSLLGNDVGKIQNKMNEELNGLGTGFFAGMGKSHILFYSDSGCRFSGEISNSIFWIRPTRGFKDAFTERCTGDRYTGVYPECGYGNRLRRFNRAE